MADETMTTKAQKTIDKLAGRSDLDRQQILRLAAARKAQRGTSERLVSGKYTIEIEHHIYTGGHWSATAWLSGTTFCGERCLASNATEAECRASVAKFIGQ